MEEVISLYLHIDELKIQETPVSQHYLSEIETDSRILDFRNHRTLLSKFQDIGGNFKITRNLASVGENFKEGHKI